MSDDFPSRGAGHIKRLTPIKSRGQRVTKTKPSATPDNEAIESKSVDQPLVSTRMSSYTRTRKMNPFHVLPDEILVDIFVHSGNPNFPLTCRSLFAALSKSDYVKRRLIICSFSADWGVERRLQLRKEQFGEYQYVSDPHIQNVLVAQSWFTLELFASAYQLWLGQQSEEMRSVDAACHQVDGQPATLLRYLRRPYETFEQRGLEAIKRPPPFEPILRHQPLFAHIYGYLLLNCDTSSLPSRPSKMTLIHPDVGTPSNLITAPISKRKAQKLLWVTSQLGGWPSQSRSMPHWEHTRPLVMDMIRVGCTQSTTVDTLATLITYAQIINSAKYWRRDQHELLLDDIELREYIDSKDLAADEKIRARFSSSVAGFLITLGVDVLLHESNHYHGQIVSPFEWRKLRSRSR